MSERKDMKKQVMFIRTGDGFIPEGLRLEGFRVEKPFYEKGLLFRILREAWFRLKLPGKELFYNKKVKDFQGKYLIIYDPQITKPYLQWLLRQNRWKIIFFYGNMVGRARHLKPDQIPEGVEKWTYERHDSAKYGMKLNERMCYCTGYCYPKEAPEYDVLYVGRDKGRGEFLFSLEKELNRVGLRTFFRIIGDTRFDKNKDPRYGQEMPYEEICQLIARSRSILNVTLPGQEGITIRDFEAICNETKLITTNPAITKRDFYKPENILVVDQTDPEQIKAFLDVPMVPYGADIRRQLSQESWVEKMIGENES